MPKTRRTSNIITDRINDYQVSLSPVEAAYTAGIIDGEGTISILRVSKRGTHHILSPKVYVSNTSELLLGWLSERLEMKVNSRIKRSNKYKNEPRPEITLAIFGYRCYNFLKIIEPYLIVKKELAHLVMEFIESRQANGQANYNSPYTESELAVWQKVRSINRRESSPYDESVSLTITSTT